MPDKPVALEARTSAADGRVWSPSVARNRDVIREAFLGVVADGSRVLELASGTGEHGAHIVEATQSLTWTYSDIDPAGLASQAARAHGTGEGAPGGLQGRLQGPVRLDIRQATPDVPELSDPFDAIFAANLLHIAPFAIVDALFARAAGLLTGSGLVCLYGPFAQDGDIAPSNASFSDDLRRRDPSWGVRDLQRDVLSQAQTHGFHLQQSTPMPSNNLFVVLKQAR